MNRMEPSNKGTIRKSETEAKRQSVEKTTVELKVLISREQLGLISGVSVDEVDAELGEAPVRSWRKGGCRVVLTDHVNAAEDEEVPSELDPGGEFFGVGLLGDGEGVCSVAVVIDDCPSEEDAVEGAVDTVLWRISVEEQDEEEMFEK